MELRLYLRMLLKRWWLIFLAFVITIIPAILLVNRQSWVYESTATFVIRPRSTFAADEEEFVKAVDILSRRVEINTTFAEVAGSRLIKQRAIERLDLSSQERKGLKIKGDVIAGTNVLEITIQGANPGIVRDFATAVSVETVNYIKNLYDVFELEPLDAATFPSKPVSPNKVLNLAVAGTFGLLLGVGLVFLIEYIGQPVAGNESFDVIDPESGVYNRPYLLLRLRQELSRVRHSSYDSSLALIHLSQRNLVSGAFHPIRPAQAASQLAALLGPELRDEDILAHLGDSTFALLLPETSREKAKDFLQDLRANMGLLAPDGVGKEKGVTMYSAVGIATLKRDGLTGEEILAQATGELEEAKATAHGRVEALAEKESRRNHIPQRQIG